jgi:dUTP pyrophosphatase
MESAGLKIVFDPLFKDFLQSKYTDTVQYNCDVGYDLYITQDIIIEPGETKFINLGIRVEYSNINESFGFILAPRSSISKTKLRLANSIGIIDPSYRGYLIAAVDNIGSEIEIVKQGQRLFQLIFTKLNKPAYIDIVDELSDTKRGSSGFGSTGV